MKHLRVLGPILLLLVGCDGEGGMGDPLRPDAGMMMGPAPEYHADVAPIVQRECLSCHVEGGAGPFPLDTYERLSDEIDNVIAAVESEYMPPWLPDDDCMELANPRGLTADERATFAAWQAGGLVRGDPADQPPPPPGPPAFEETHVARMLEPYTPDETAPDDYRCFILDHEFTEDSFLTGRNVVPGASALVHHVLVYAAPPFMVDAMMQADADDEGPGYTCFGGPVPGADSEGQGGSLGLIAMGGWVPGQIPVVEREGRAVYVPAGSRIVMQVHYNLLGGDPEPDETEYHMALSTEPPEFLVTTFPTAILELNIRAGMPENRHRATFRNYRSDAMQLTGFLPHMHLLGTEIGMNRVPASGENQCLIDIPDWDFNWQQQYTLPEGRTVTLEPGDGLELTCVYDNSESNQPVVNGEQIESRDVTWGEGTLDEMCLLYVQHEEPWTGPPTYGCENASACLEGCTDGDAACLLRCEELAGGCRVCMLQETLGCARDACLSALAPTIGCLQSCIFSYAMLGGSFERCIDAECGEGVWDPAVACVDAQIEGGACDPMTACAAP